MSELNRYWDVLIEDDVATQEELQLVTCINGFKEETLDDVLYARTGYRDLDQYEGVEE